MLPCQGKTPYLHFWPIYFCTLNFLIIWFFVLPTFFLNKNPPVIDLQCTCLPYLHNWGPLSRQNAVSAHIRRFALTSHVDTAFCLDNTCRYGVLPWQYTQIRLSAILTALWVRTLVHTGICFNTHVYIYTHSNHTIFYSNHTIPFILQPLVTGN